MTLHINAERAAHIDALAPDRSGVPSLLRECSPEMEKAEQRIARTPLGEESRLTALRQLLAKSERECQRIVWRG